jgi:hypothetical protein
LRGSGKHRNETGEKDNQEGEARSLHGHVTFPRLSSLINARAASRDSFFALGVFRDSLVAANSVSKFFCGTEPVVDITTRFRAPREVPVIRTEANLFLEALIYGSLILTHNIIHRPLLLRISAMRTCDAGRSSSV